MSKKYIISIIVIAVSVFGFWYFKNSQKETPDFITVERGDLKQEVSITGKVKPASRVDLAFESSGKISGVYVKVGDIVTSGQKLATLDSSQYLAQYNQAKATLEGERSKLAELKRGTRSEELEVQRVKVQNAKQSLSDAKNNLIVKIKDSFINSDNAIRNKVDQLFDNPKTSSPQIIFVTSFELESALESERLYIEEMLNAWNISISNGIVSDLSINTEKAKYNLNRISSFLDKAALAVNGMNVTPVFTQTKIDGYRLDISNSRTNVNTALSSLITADEKLRTAESSLALEEKELTLLEAGTVEEQINQQESKIKSAEANVANYQALISKTILYSPINGIITKEDLEVGEIFQSNTPAISIMSGGEFEIEAFIPEADVANVRVGDMAKIVLDAYDEKEATFEAKIITIDPAETIIEGISTYKTILRFTQKDNRIKSGMTANIDILTEEKKNVLFVPNRVIIENEKKTVIVLLKDNQIEVEVETGMKSSEGYIEIVSGLNEGDMIIISK